MSNRVFFSLTFALLVLLLVLGKYESPPTGLVVIQIGEKVSEELGVISEQNNDALRSSTLHTGLGKTTVRQFLNTQTLADGTALQGGQIVHESNEQGETGTYLKYQQSNVIFEYMLLPDEGMKIEADGRGLEGKRLQILGQDFEFTQAKFDKDGNTVQLELIAVPTKIELREGETKIFETGAGSDALSCSLTPQIIAETNVGDAKKPVVRFGIKCLKKATQEVMYEGISPIVEEDKIFTLGENKELKFAATDILIDEDGKDLVYLAVGAKTNRIKLKDSNYESSTFERGVDVNGEDIRNGLLEIGGTEEDNGNILNIHTIRYRVEAQGPRGDVYVPQGQGLRSALKQPDSMLSPAWDIRFEGLEPKSKQPRLNGTTSVHFNAKNSRYNLEFTNTKGSFYELPFLYVESGTVGLGKSNDHKLVLTEGSASNDFVIREGDYFAVTSENSYKGETHVLEYVGTDTSGKNALFEDLATGNKKIPLFQAFLIREAIKVPLTPLSMLTGFEAAEGAEGQQAEQQPAPESASQSQPEQSAQQPQPPPSNPEPQPETPRQDARDARNNAMAEQCRENLRLIQTELGNIVGGVGIQQRDGNLYLQWLGTKEFAVCSEFFNFHVVEGAFPFSEQAIQQEMQRCKKMVNIPSTVQACPNYQDMLNAIDQLCNELGDTLRAMNGMQNEIMAEYRTKCLPKLQKDVDDWNQAHGTGALLPGGQAPPVPPSTPETPPQTPPPSTPPPTPPTPPQLPGGQTPGTPPASSPIPQTPQPEDEKFICCEYCPSTKYFRFYVPFAGNNCEPTDVQRDDLSQEACGNPLYDQMPTPEEVENAPKIYGPFCPNQKDLEQKDKQKKCEDAKKAYLAIQARYEQLVAVARQILARFEASYYQDAKAEYQTAMNQAHDAYFKELLPARDTAKKFCDGVVPPAPPEPEIQPLPTPTPSPTPTPAPPSTTPTPTTPPSTPPATPPAPSSQPSFQVPPPGSPPIQLVPGASSTMGITPQPPPPGQPIPSISVTPTNTNFKNSISTPLHEMNEEQLKKVSDLKLGVPGKGSVKFLENIDARGIDFDKHVRVEPGSITVDVSAVPELNKPAILTMENMKIKNPAVLADGSFCKDCKRVSYQDGTLTFQVDHFTTFTVVEAETFATGTLVVGGKSYEFIVGNSANNPIVVDQNGDGKLDGTRTRFTVLGGGVLSVGAAGDTTDVTWIFDDKLMKNNVEEQIVMRFTRTDSKLGVNLPHNKTHEVEGTKYEQALFPSGALFTIEDRNYQNDLTIETGVKGQRLASVKVTSG